MRLFAAIFALALTAGTLLAADNRPVVRIGMSVPLTGAYHQYGQSAVAWKDHLLRKIEDRNTQLRYQVLVADDKMDPRSALRVARKFITEDKINVLLSYSSPCGTSIAPYAAVHKVPHFAVAYNPAVVLGDTTVSLVPPPEDYVPTFQKILEKKKWRRLALFYVKSSTWQPIYNQIQKLAKDGKLQITYEKQYLPEDTNYLPDVQAIPADYVDAIVILAWNPQVNQIVSTIRQVPVEKPLLSLGGGFLMADRSKIYDGALDIFWGGMEEADKLNRQLTGQAIYTPYGGSAYDAISMTVGIYERYWTQNKKLIPPDEFMKEVRKLREYPSVFGRISCLPSGFFSFESHIYRIQDGTFREVRLNDL